MPLDFILRKGHVDFPFFNACVCPSSAEVVDSMDPKLAADTNQNYDLLLSLLQSICHL